MEHAGRVTRASSPRAFGRLWPSWSTPGRKPERLAPERSVGSLAAVLEHAGWLTRARGSRAFVCSAWAPQGAGRMVTRASSPRAFGRLACGSHGARRGENPNVEPPSDRSARLEHTVVWEIFIRSSNKSTVG